MKHTVDSLMALAYKIRDARTYEWDVSEAVEAGNTLRAALTEALAQLTGCLSNCDTCTYAHGSPAQAGYCYMFYGEPQGVCGKWKDANPNISKYPEKDISAQPTREPLTDDQIVSACYSFRHDFGLLPQETRDSLIRTATDWAQAFGIGGDK